ncbi:Sodium-dependent dicarboxylate transporter SdcS (Na(+)/dicarboxylate symporter) [Durusdinium trenchii]|uniref:Sodium-dependent dicarboxylate transporter SdcS (Na(+)/dicarboxylate symporter) n=1 Tax=Durusdinium trenchii TaxID=1381693 RepID=A0ABP0Q5I1_9DINO
MVVAIKTEVTVDAPIDTVWQELLNLDAWDKWAHGMSFAPGTKLEAGKSAKLNLPVGKNSTRQVPVTIHDADNYLLRWGGSALCLFAGTHYFQLEEVDASTTRVVHAEDFSGLLPWMFSSRMHKQVGKLYVKISESFKAHTRKEGRLRRGPGAGERGAPGSAAVHKERFGRGGFGEGGRTPPPWRRIIEEHPSQRALVKDQDEGFHLEVSGCVRMWSVEWVKSFSVSQRVGLVLGPILAIVMSQIEISDENPLANEALAVTAFITTWWIFEVVPIPVTALAPLILFPIAKVQTGRVVASQYYNFVTFLLLGAFLVVVALEKVKAHKRFALLALQLFGVQPRRILLGFMLVAWLLSMFASNTSTTILLVPLINGLLEGHTDSPDGQRFLKGSLLGVAYGATAGGVSTVIGTAPNAILVLIFSQQFPDGPSINFSSWFLFAFPISLIMVVSSWAVLCLVYLRGVKIDLNKDHMLEELRALGPVRRDEVAVTAVLICLIILWLIRPYVFDEFLGNCVLDDGTISEVVTTESACEDVVGASWREFVDDGTVACIGAFLLFLIPSAERPGEKILDEDAFNHLPWGILLLFGAGFAIANAFASSGLSLEIGTALGSFADLSAFGLVLLITTFVCFLTEVTSNTATATIFLPILIGVALNEEINPLKLLLPATVATSLAFMLPIATPPNAVIFATGQITFWDMIKAGFFLNIIGILVVSCFTFISGASFGDLTEFPEWANVAVALAAHSMALLGDSAVMVVDAASYGLNWRAERRKELAEARKVKLKPEELMQLEVHIPLFSATCLAIVMVAVASDAVVVLKAPAPRLQNVVNEPLAMGLGLVNLAVDGLIQCSTRPRSTVSLHSWWAPP